MNATPSISPENEIEVLSILLAKPLLFIESSIQSEYFQDDTHRKLFNIMRREFTSTGLILYDNIKDIDDEDVTRCFVLVVRVPYNFKVFYSILNKMENRYQRGVMENLSFKLNQLINSETPLSKINSFLESSFFSLLQTKHAGIRDIRHDVVQKLSLNQSHLELIPSFNLMFGLPPLDKIVGGIGMDEVTVIASRPAMGKTSFVVDTALKMITIHNKKVLFFSMEMDKWSIYLKIFANLMNINSNDLRGQLSLTDQNNILNVMENNIPSNSLFVVDGSNTNRNIQDIKSQARLIVYRYKMDVIFIDYIQLLKVSMDGKNREKHVELSDVIIEIKYLAKELKVPIIILSQLSRQTMSKDEPSLEDIKYSGAIEEHSDRVIFLYNFKGEKMMSVAKNRLGEVGTLKVRYIPEYSKFESIN